VLLEDDWDTPSPLFRSDPPGGGVAPELRRQTIFFRDMRMLAPEVLIYANANAGKRNPTKARQEGVVAGIFDIAARWQGGGAEIELKGWQPGAKRWGKLSDAQIRWGNRMHRLEHQVACFYDPIEAMLWLRDLGAPVRIR
jgi:hypothetical protein